MNVNEVSWTPAQVHDLYQLPFIELMYQAQSIHRKNFNPHTIQKNVLLSIKTGACPEDCAYCPQSGHYQTVVEKEALMSFDEMLAKAKAAKELGAHRFCMGAAWRNLPKKELPKMIAIIKGIKELSEIPS